MGWEINNHFYKEKRKQSKKKRNKNLIDKNGVTLFKLNSLVYSVQGCEMKPTGLYADRHSLASSKVLVMKNYTTGGNVDFFGTVALHKKIRKVNQKST